MIELDVKINENVPGYMEFSCIGDARFIDKSKGRKKTEWGEAWREDKIVSVAAHTVEETAERLGNAITEVLSK